MLSMAFISAIAPQLEKNTKPREFAIPAHILFLFITLGEIHNINSLEYVARAKHFSLKSLTGNGLEGYRVRQLKIDTYTEPHKKALRYTKVLILARDWESHIAVLGPVSPGLKMS